VNVSVVRRVQMLPVRWLRAVSALLRVLRGSTETVGSWEGKQRYSPGVVFGVVVGHGMAVATGTALVLACRLEEARLGLCFGRCGIASKRGEMATVARTT